VLDVIIFESIKDISCPKTEVTKKCVLLSIVVYVCAKQNYEKELGVPYGLPSLILLSYNSVYKTRL